MPASEPLRVGIIGHRPPVFSRCAFDSNLKITKNCWQPGYAVEAFDIILRAANVKYELIKREGGIQEKIEFMTNGTVDTVIMPLSPTMERLRELKTSYLIGAFDEHMYVLGTARHTDDYRHRALSFLHVYYVWVWLAAASLVLFNKAFKHCWLNPTRKTQNALHSYACNTTTIGIFTLLFVGLYRCGLLVNLLSFRKLYQFNSFDELVAKIESGELNVIAFKAAWMDIKSSDMERLLDVLEKNPMCEIRSLSDVEGAKNKIQDGSGVLLTIESTVRRQYRRWCGTRYMKLDTIGHYKNGFLFNKNVSDALIRRVNRAIIESEPGLQQITNRYMNALRESQQNCSHADIQTEKSADVPIGLQGIVGVALMYIVGNGIGLTMLVLECLYYSCYIQHD